MKGSRLKSIALATAALMLVGGISLYLNPQKAYAQGNNPIDQILAKLDQILTGLNLSSGTVVLSTGFAKASFARGDLSEVECSLANVSDAPLTVQFRIVDTGGNFAEVDNNSTTATRVVPAGEGTAITPLAIGVPGGVFGRYRCEFQFTGTARAVRANIRATMDSPDPSESEVAVLEAR